MSEQQTQAWLDELCAALPAGALLERASFRGQHSLLVDPGLLVSVMKLLKDRGGFRYLADLTALDRLPREPRFLLVYHLWNHAERRLIRVKTEARGDPPTVLSVTALWTTANWHERECYDLFGVEFRGHPDLRRILTADGWVGHPLRKDYPTMGPPEVQNWVPPRYAPPVPAATPTGGEGAAS